MISLLPEGYEGSGPKLKALQDEATAAMVREIAHQFLSPANRTPTLVDHVLMFDSVAGRYLPERAVLIADGKVAAAGPAGSIKLRPGVVRINGRGKTLTPGLWDSHQHVGDDWNLLQNVASGMTNYRSPGTTIDEALSIVASAAVGGVDRWVVRNPQVNRWFHHSRRMAVVLDGGRLLGDLCGGVIGVNDAADAKS